MTAILSFLAVGSATAVLAVGYATSGGWHLALLVAAVGLFWLLGRWRGWAWSASLGLVAFVVAAAVGIWLGVGVVWMLAAVVTALAAWDLHRFAEQIRSVQRVDNAFGLEGGHLLRLSLVAALGALLAGLALMIHLDFGLGWALVLGLLIIVAIGQAIRLIRLDRGS